MLVKMETFPKFRGENSKNVWVATTQLLMPPSFVGEIQSSSRFSLVSSTRLTCLSWRHRFGVFYRFQQQQKRHQKLIHPQKLTWNLEMMVSNRNLLFQGSIFRFHVCFGGCNWFVIGFLLRENSWYLYRICNRDMLMIYWYCFLVVELGQEVFFPWPMIQKS